MSDRERWIVYPLLFLALGAALRDKIHKQTRAKEIVCERLYLTDSDGQPTAVMIGDPATPISQDEVTMAQRRGAKLFIGYVSSNVVDAENLAQRGQRVNSDGLSLQQLSRLFSLFRSSPQRGLRLVPGPLDQANPPSQPPPVESPAAPPREPASEAAEPSETDSRT